MCIVFNFNNSGAVMRLYEAHPSLIVHSMVLFLLNTHEKTIVKYFFTVAVVIVI